jgi:Uncharacterized conserved protein
VAFQAFRMKLKPGMQARYEAEHDAIWPELAALLRGAGISDYSIFLDPDSLDLFAVFRLAEGKGLDDLSDHPVMRRWWDHMAPLMEVKPGNRPKEQPLRRVFYLS